MYLLVTSELALGLFCFSKWVFQFPSTIIFERQLKRTINLSFLKNLGVLFHKYVSVFSKRSEYFFLENRSNNSKNKAQ